MKYKRSITIDNSNARCGILDYPLMIKEEQIGSEIDLRTVIFFDKDGNKLNRDRDFEKGFGGFCPIIPELSATEDTDIYVEYKLKKPKQIKSKSRDWLISFKGIEYHYFGTKEDGLIDPDYGDAGYAYLNKDGVFKYQVKIGEVKDVKFIRRIKDEL